MIKTKIHLADIVTMMEMFSRFDELHYGKYAGLYMQNTFFFDSQPPLGKQLVALAAYLAGFDGMWMKSLLDFAIFVIHYDLH